MKTKLFFAALLITTITFSQNSKKGYNYYKAKSDVTKSKKMNKGELIDAMAKDGNSSAKKIGKMGNHPNVAKHNWINSPSRAKNSKQKNDLHLRKRPGRSQGDPIPGIGITKEQGNTKYTRKRPGRTKYSNSNDILLRKRPGRTKYKNSKSNMTETIKPSVPSKATDYNSSRSNKNANH